MKITDVLKLLKNERKDTVTNRITLLQCYHVQIFLLQIVDMKTRIIKNDLWKKGTSVYGAVNASINNLGIIVAHPMKVIYTYLLTYTYVLASSNALDFSIFSLAFILHSVE